tara:strand:- start:374 stop:580 length:207 start_codon:yes stop_codon:yes gene_type:complete
MNNYSLEYIRKCLFRIYENYGLNTDDMSEAEIERICDYYYNNQNIFKRDLLKSNVISDDGKLIENEDD